MQIIGDAGRLNLREPIWKKLFVKKEVVVHEKKKTATVKGEESVFPYGDEYKKVRAFYRFVE